MISRLNSQPARRRTDGWLRMLLSMFAFCAVWLLLTAVAPAQDQQADQPPAEENAAENPDEPAADNPEGEAEAEEKPLPTLEEMQPLSVEQLMKGPAEDWVVLNFKEQVVVVQPVEPRPNTLETLAEWAKEPRKYEPQDLGRDEEGNPLEGEALENARRLWRKSLAYVKVHMPFDAENITEEADREYFIKTREIKQIIYFEDMMLKQIDAFLDNGQISEAYEMVVALRRRNSQWPGLEFREQRLLFAEAKRLQQEGKHELAFVDLEQLHQRVPDFPQLSEAMGEAADGMISSAYDAGDYRRARHFLKRLETQYPQHRTAARWTETMTARTAELMDQAQAAESAGDIEKALAATETATQIWPTASGLRTLYARLARRHQKLRVGVLTLPGDDVSPLDRTPADDRQRELTQSALFEPDFLDEQIVRYRSRYLNEWEPTNLGRRIRFELRPFRQTWESQPVTNAMPMIRQLADKLRSDSQTFDERLSDRISSVSLKSPFVFDVEFDSVPLRPESLFSYALSAPGSFELSQRDAQSVTYRRAIPEPADEKEFHVAEVIEQKYDTHEKAIQALLRGQVDMLPQVPLRDVDVLRDHPQFFVHKYQLPKTHVVQFNIRNKALRSRSLRRAMAACIDSERLLEEFVLKAPNNGKARLTSAPFPQTSYAYDPAVQPLSYDLELAVALSVAARKELGGAFPKLTLRAPPDPESRAVAKQLIAAWSRIGLDVTLADVDAPVTDDNWDVAYRKVSMREPAVELWPLLTGTDQAEIADLERLPHWLRQKLLELDGVSDWARAEGLLHALHRDLLAEVQLIPLWETDEYLLVRKTVRGVPEAPISTYDGIEQWVVQPWYPLK